MVAGIACSTACIVVCSDMYCLYWHVLFILTVMCGYVGMYLWFTYGDASAGSNLDEKDIDKRVMEAIEMEDPAIVADLRHLSKNSSDKYSVFWTYCYKFLDDCTAVQERRHDSVCI